MPLTYKLTKKILDELNFRLDHQTGSHMIFKLSDSIVVVPYKKEFASGTAKSIIQRISQISGIDTKYIITHYTIKF